MWCVSVQLARIQSLFSPFSLLAHLARFIWSPPRGSSFDSSAIEIVGGSN